MGFAITGIIFIFLLAAGSIGGVLFVKLNQRKALLETNISRLKAEGKAKQTVLEEISEIALGLISPGAIDKMKKKVEELDETLRAEKGRLTITQAELDAVETRLRELEEVERELEASSIEAAKEVEMLRSQERDIQARNEKLKEQLQLSMDQIDILLDQFHSSQATVDQLHAMKAQLEQTQEKIEFYSAQLAEINKSYMDLKNAYDALDIEYAQLYEKHQAMGGT